MVIKYNDDKKEECKCEKCKWLRRNVTWIGSPPKCDKHKYKLCKMIA